MKSATSRSLERSAVVVRQGLPAGQWDDYVRNHPGAAGHHLWAWPGILSRSFGHETCLLSAESRGRVAGVLPLVFFDSRLFGRFAVSLPFVNYGGVLADSVEAGGALLDAAIAETRQRGGTHLELRHTVQQFPHLSSRRHKVAMILKLEGSVERQWQALDRKVRNQIRKGEKLGVRVTCGGVQLLDPFYEVFARNMRDLGTPVYSRRLFVEVLSAFPDHAAIFVAWHGERPVAASLVTWRGAVIEVPWASSIRALNSLCANVLLYWEMVQFATTRGFARFDFGRSTPFEGTYQFKQQWGAEAHPVVWEYWLADDRDVPDLSPHNPRFGPAISVWRRFPVPVTRLIGPWIVRNIP